MTITELKKLVDVTQAAYGLIQHREWNGHRYGMSETEMWVEASCSAPLPWREIIRVLAQGGEYYGLQWPWLAELASRPDREQGDPFDPDPNTTRRTPWDAY